MELTTTESYTMAQLLVLGDVDVNQFKSANKFMGTTQNKALMRLNQKGMLDYTLLEVNQILTPQYDNY